MTPSPSIMKLMSAAVTVLYLVASSAFAAGEQPPQGFTSLFNGRDFTGWKVPEGDNGHWKVVDGVIDYDARSEAPKDKNLFTEKSFTDFVLRVDWRIKETPYVNPNVPYILPDGTHARDVNGKEIRMALPDSDSGVILRGDVKNQVNIWCWPIGSGEMYGWRTDPRQPPEVRAAVTPRTQADKPVGQWNTYEITVKGEAVTVKLNDKLVVDGVVLENYWNYDKPLFPTGQIELQNHGNTLYFKNIYVKELPRK